MKLTKKFFKENPLDEYNVAEFAKAQFIIAGNNKIDELSRQFVTENISVERNREIEEELKVIEAAQTPDDFISYMRKKGDIVNRGALIIAVKKYEDEVVPEILRYFYRNTVDGFLETADCIIYNSDIKYAEELFENYNKIRAPYACALACLLFEMSCIADDDTLTDFLYDKFNYFKRNYPEEGYYKFPLLALLDIYESSNRK